MVFYGITTGPLVCTIFALFIYMMKILLLVFFRLTIFTNRSRVQRWLTPFNIFALKLKFVVFPPNSKISFVVFFATVLFFSHRVSKRCALSYSIICRAPIGDIRQPSDSGSGAPDPDAFIQYVDGRQPMSQKLWCHRIDGI